MPLRREGLLYVAMQEPALHAHGQRIRTPVLGELEVIHLLYLSIS